MKGRNKTKHSIYFCFWF